MSDLELYNKTLIRPITLANYSIIKNRDIDIGDASILDIASCFVSKGIKYGIRGDLIFILVMYLNDNFYDSIPADCDYLGFGSASNYSESVDIIMKYINDMNKGDILYKPISSNPELTVGDLLAHIKPPGYDSSLYVSYDEAEAYRDTYIYQYMRLYYIIYEFEQNMLMEQGELIQPIESVKYEDMVHSASNRLKDQQGDSYNNNSLVTYSNPNNMSTAVLLSQKYKCPFIFTNGDDIFDKFTIINADEF